MTNRLKTNIKYLLNDMKLLRLELAGHRGRGSGIQELHLTADDTVSLAYSWKDTMISAPGNPYGSQCVALMQLIQHHNGVPLFRLDAQDWLQGASNDPSRYDVIHYSAGVQAQKGDWVVYLTPNLVYGHIGLVTSDSDGVTLQTLEANVDDRPDFLINGGPVRELHRNISDGYAGNMKLLGFIRPKYKKKVTSTNQQPTSFRKLKDENGTMTVTVDKLNVRTQPSTTTGQIVATYQKGESMRYDSVYSGSGYIWVSYVSYSGPRRYVAAGVASQDGLRNVSKYGTFR